MISAIREHDNVPELKVFKKSMPMTYISIHKVNNREGCVVMT